MNYKLLCKVCDTPVRLTSTRAYMRCLCDEDVRIIDIDTTDNVLRSVPENLYLLESHLFTRNICESV